MPRPDRSHALDHVVVIMFENRSFDNLLGRLYQPGEVASFAGVAGLDLSNPVPEWAAGADPGTAPRLVPYGTATDMNSPSPDPGEEYPHVNTQLFGLIDPPSNRGMVIEHIAAPYNAPGSPGQRPTMDGFVTDYISAFTAEMGRPPAFEEYAQIMTGYAPVQVPVTSALARGFATFDHWFCEVPSQTFPNRSFFHAGTSSGYVINMEPAESFPLHNDAETIFERLEKHGLTWRVYCDPPSHISLTGIIHAPRLRERWATNFFTTDRFLQDAATGQLPAYSFIEPNLLYGHNDMHPAFDALFPGVDLDPPSALLGGEALLAKIYDAIRCSASPDGSNAYNTLFMVCFDEHGGTYDHVPPPARAAAGPDRSSRADGLPVRPVRPARARHCRLALGPGADGGQRSVPAHVGDPGAAGTLAARRAADRPRRSRPGPRPGAVPGHSARPGRLAGCRAAAGGLRSTRLMSRSKPG